MATSGYLSEHSESSTSTHSFRFDGKNPPGEFADLLDRSLALYLSIEKLHWHLRLNIGCSHGQIGNCAELARQASSESLRLIGKISRLQQSLRPGIALEPAELSAALFERQVQNLELTHHTPYRPEI